MTLIAVDSIAVDPLEAAHPSSLGVLYPGQRMDVLLRQSAGQSSKSTDGGSASALRIDLDEEYVNTYLPTYLPTLHVHLSTYTAQQLTKSPKSNKQMLQIPQPSPNTHPNLPHLPHLPFPPLTPRIKPHPQPQPNRPPHNPLPLPHPPPTQYPPQPIHNSSSLHQNPKARHPPQRPLRLLQRHLLAAAARAASSRRCIGEGTVG